MNAPDRIKTPRKKMKSRLPKLILTISLSPSAAPVIVTIPPFVATSSPSVTPRSGIKIMTMRDVMAKGSASVTHSTMANTRSDMQMRPWWESSMTLSPKVSVSGRGAR
jgi:hypothetical protein